MYALVFIILHFNLMFIKWWLAARNWTTGLGLCGPIKLQIFCMHVLYMSQM